MNTESVLTKKQIKKFGPRSIAGWGQGATITAKVRYDDECGNGYNTFAITGEIRVPTRRDCEACGCLHEDIARVFPELAPLIKWHLVSSDGPMYYILNATFFAGERDCWGKLKGEPKQWGTTITFGANPIRHYFKPNFIGFLQTVGAPYDFKVLPYEHENGPSETYKFAPKYTFGGFAEKWYQCPFDTEQEALDFLYALRHCEPKFTRTPTAWGEGKARELDKARTTACWPDATDEDLTAPGLEERLKARLPGLLADFRRDVEALGFTY